ncbi:sulfotransferase family 2 domain-containing protein [uncultured Eudoraea sp.]|uniref:sulfotransferase family 2 domain-containing protein n=1 Tax=uncultured Eudoraea sp. TaxID=1035614 RepID=UPI002632BE26|nr:sulfotransferase family 2 domain-containing protein [uncultured Eudoraea sp.]
MIISHKYKYIFIGLPFSGSSAISKELIEQYEGEPLFHKHANIPLLHKIMPSLNLEEYYIFVVVRDPLEMCFSVYNKHLANPYNTFTDSQYFIENGGFVSQKARKFYKRVQAQKMTFEDFLKAKYHLAPYDDNLTINSKYLDGVLRFDQLTSDFENLLLKLGITPQRELPVYNKTNKKTKDYIISEKTFQNIFSAFILQHKALFNEMQYPKPTIMNIVRFKIKSYLRFYKVLKYDLKQMNNSFSIKDLNNER